MTATFEEKILDKLNAIEQNQVRHDSRLEVIEKQSASFGQLGERVSRLEAVHELTFAKSIEDLKKENQELRKENQATKKHFDSAIEAIHRKTRGYDKRLWLVSGGVGLLAIILAIINAYSSLVK